MEESNALLEKMSTENGFFPAPMVRLHIYLFIYLFIFWLLVYLLIEPGDLKWKENLLFPPYMSLKEKILLVSLLFPS